MKGGKMTRIPDCVTEKHLRSAAERIDREGFPKRRASTRWDVEIEGKLYPQKYIISLAVEKATGAAFPGDRFKAKDAREFFTNRRYLLVDKNQRRQESE